MLKYFDCQTIVQKTIGNYTDVIFIIISQGFAVNIL